MGGHLSPYSMKPALDCSGEGRVCNGFRYGATTMQGWRKHQEDAYKCEIDWTNGYNYFAVFDGHGGSEVAKYLEKHLHRDIETFLTKQSDPELALQLGFLSCDASLREPSGIKELNDLVEAENRVTVANIEKHRKAIYNMAVDNSDGAGCSRDIFNFSSALNSAGDVDSNSDPQEEEQEKDMDTLKYLLNDDLDPEISDPEDEDFDVEDEASSSDSGNEETFEYEQLKPGVHSGSTGTVLLFDSKHYYCANVGDSRCVLCRGGKAIDLSVDHKPDDPDEARRINATGSIVSDGRINKSLNLSRAFGDFYYKEASLAPFEQCVTVEPSIISLPVQNDDQFIIIASDGIWNSMSSQDVVDFVSLRLKEEENLRTITEELFRLIITPNTDGDGTGCDNMTCIIIKVDPSQLDHDPATIHITSEEKHLSNSTDSDTLTEKN